MANAEVGASLDTIYRLAIDHFQDNYDPRSYNITPDDGLVGSYPIDQTGEFEEKIGSTPLSWITQIYARFISFFQPDSGDTHTQKVLEEPNDPERKVLTLESKESLGMRCQLEHIIYTGNSADAIIFRILTQTTKTALRVWPSNDSSRTGEVNAWLIYPGDYILQYPPAAGNELDETTVQKARTHIEACEQLDTEPHSFYTAVIQVNELLSLGFDFGITEEIAGGLQQLLYTALQYEDWTIAENE